MKKYFIILFLLTALTTCKKEPDAPTGGNKIEFGQTTADSIGYYSAKVSTTMESTLGNDISQHGHCWSTKNNPTIDDNKTTLGKLDKPETFSSEITGLQANKTYYIRSYVTYKYGTAYGKEESIKTLKAGKPSVNTLEVQDVDLYSAKFNGKVVGDSGLLVNARGVCWNTTGNPTLENNSGFTNDGNGTGSFTSQLTGLTDNTTYYVAAFATNEKGTAYGQVKDFLAINYFTDPRDGQTYKTVVIGSQTWFAENLNYEAADSWWYDSSSANGEVYGRLYTWDAALAACPGGWKLPTDNEWKMLEIYLGMSQSEADQTGWRGTDEGGKLKEAGTAHWNAPNTGATNSSGFTALPGGIRSSNGSFYSLGLDGRWWSSTESSGTNAWNRHLTYGYQQVRRTNSLKSSGFSVRCLKN